MLGYMLGQRNCPCESSEAGFYSQSLTKSAKKEKNLFVKIQTHLCYKEKLIFGSVCMCLFAQQDGGT